MGNASNSNTINKKSNNKPSAGLLSLRSVCFICLALFLFAPLFALLINLNGSDLSQVFTDSIFYQALLNSLLYTSISTLISTILAFIAAYFLSRITFKRKNIFVLFLTVPMLIPTLSIGLGVKNLFGTGGYLDAIFHINFDALGMPGLILGSIIVSFPISFLIIYDALRYEDRFTYDAASTLGINGFKQFYSITLPYIKIALISAFFASFTLVFSDYGVPMEVAGKVKTLPMYLYDVAIGSTPNYAQAATVGLVLLLPAIGALLFDIFSKEESTNEAKNQLIKPSLIFNIIAISLIVLIIIFVLIPQLSFLITSFVTRYPNDMSLTFSHYIDAFSKNTGQGIPKLLLNSIIIALFAGIFGTIIAYLLAYLNVRIGSKIDKIIHFCAIASLAIPGLVLGIGYVFLFNITQGFFYGTIIILVVVNIFHFLASPYLLAKNALAKLNNNYEVVGSTFHSSKPSILFHVLIPQTIPTILEMFSYFFVNSMITISAVAFLYTSSDMPLAIQISRFEKDGNLELEAVVSTILLVVNIFAKGILSLLSFLIKNKTKEKEVETMALTRYQFDLLTYLEKKGPGKYTQRNLSDNLGLSLGTINKLLKDYSEEDVIQISDDKVISITDKGIKLLEPYKVRKAIIIAAGFGSRLAPVTLLTPKPLVKVNGVRMIDTMIDSLLEVGIDNITIVRGYKKEQFDSLLKKYPNLKFIDNPLYNETNNISSIFVARDIIDRCYICEADLIVSNHNVIQKYQYVSNYLGAYVKETDDWCFETKNDVIKKVAIGGENCYQMIGISYWNEKDSAMLRDDVVKVFNSRGGKENYWDNVPLKIYHKDFSIQVRPCERKDVTEIDNYSELCIIDESYENFKA